MATTLPDFYVKTADEYRDDGLRTLRNGLIRAGVANPNVSPGSDYYVLFQAIANELEVLGANLLVKADAQMPDTATEGDLDRWLQTIGLARRDAAGSSGAIVLNSSASTSIAVGTQLLDGQGFRHEVTVAGTYANGALVPIAAIDTGAKTNLDAGETLRWVAAPSYCAATALVATGGLTGGAEAEDDETARRRLLRRLASPPGSGNATHVVETAEASTPIVQAAFVYPAAQGPATQHVAVMAYPSESSKSRQVSTLTLDNVIRPYTVGALAEHSDVTVTNVTDVATDVAVDLGIPASPSASVPGPGGGWLDATPWPRPVHTSITAGSYPFCDVVAVTSSTVFQVRSLIAPSIGASRICWLSPLDWKLYTATVIGSSFISTNVYEITIDTPFAGTAGAVAVGNFISPQSVNQQAYFDAILGAFALMGPGEKLASFATNTRAYRRPVPSQQWPYSLGPQQLRELSNVGVEVLDVQYRYRSVTSPPVPGAVTGAPGILVPRNIGIYELGV